MDVKKAIITNDFFSRLKALVLDSLDSPHSQDAYGRALAGFLAWYVDQGNPGLTKAMVNEYRRHLQGMGLSPSTINQRMSAIRKLAAEAADNGLIDQTLAKGFRT